MRFSFDIKKGVLTRALLLLVIGSVIGFVIGQSGNPFVIPSSSAYHALQFVSTTSTNLTSVDSNQNGLVDTSEVSKNSLDSTRFGGMNAVEYETRANNVTCQRVFDGNNLTQYSQNDILKINVPSVCLQRACKLIVNDINAGRVVKVADYYEIAGTSGIYYSFPQATQAERNFWFIDSFKFSNGNIVADNRDWGNNGDGTEQKILDLQDNGAQDSWLYDDITGIEGSKTQWGIKNKASQSTQIIACG
ncbi:MAG: hypothetical protein AABW73_04365 [Nanoarchaeota archaeon]